MAHGCQRTMFQPKTPHFSKIIYGDMVQDEKLVIPPKFVRKYGSNMSNMVRLKLPSNAVWDIELKQGNGKVWLQEGWSEIMSFYSIKHGHLLVFRYEGDSLFHVIILAKSATEIKYPMKSDEKVQLAEMFHAETPHFFTIFFGDMTEDGKLVIPHEFVKRYGINMSNVIQLKLPSADVWEVKLHWGNGKVTLQNGWSDFVKFYSIKHVHFLFFRYEGDSLFHVIIIDKSATEIEYPMKSRSQKFQLGGQEHVTVKSEPNDGDSTNAKMSADQFASGQILNRVALDASCSKQGDQGTPSAMKPIESSNRRKDQVAKATEKSLPRTSLESKSFSITILPSHLGPNFQLNLPIHFLKDHISDFDSYKLIHLVDDDGRIWPVQYACYAQGKHKRWKKARFCYGWKQFTRDNNIKVGDVCKFELVTLRDLKISFRITVCRANERGIAPFMEN